MKPPRPAGARPVAALLIGLSLALSGSIEAEAADGATHYRIRNRWLRDQFLADAGGTVAYGTGNDPSYLWTLEDAGPHQRIRNVGTGAYMAQAAGSAAVTTSAAPGSPAGLWEAEVGIFPWRSIRSVASGRYLNCERKLGRVECDGTSLPGGDNFWSGQWEFVHAGGPTPPPYFRRNQVAVTSPPYASAVRGNIAVSIRAPGMTSATVKCWKQGESFGADSTVAEVALDPEGKGSFDFPADAYPHGPLTLRIAGRGGEARDNCYLQLYNEGGVSSGAGIPKDPPPPARGMTLAFADDFDGPLSISGTDPRATYYDHKPPGGHQDFSTLPFTSHGAPGDPFARVDTYLRIRASEKARSAGLISSLRSDGTGFKVSLPCYFECRMVGPNAIGTWPAFWLMTDYLSNSGALGDKTPCDELDIIEAYGGEGPREPNAGDTYMIAPHCWNQGERGKAIENKASEAVRNPVRMNKFGIPSTWFDTFHVYGCKVAESETTYYCDNVEVARHATLPTCKERPIFFMIDLATGGGWPVDLSRYDGVADMYVDYVRVYKR